MTPIRPSPPRRSRRLAPRARRPPRGPPASLRSPSRRPRRRRRTQLRPPAAGAAATTAPIDPLMEPGPLPRHRPGLGLGAITIVEYASMTCSHCAAFHEKTWPALKAKYIDTGKAKFILREFPLDPLATAAFMLGALRRPGQARRRRSTCCSRNRRLGRSSKSRSIRFASSPRGGHVAGEFRRLREK